jgi:protein arginine kinase activator
MKCHFCENPATVHLTDIINKKKRELHLCEACARENNLIPEPAQELNIPALLQFLLGQAQNELAKKGSDGTACPHCGIKYAQFRAQGRLGCPEDYEVFRAAIEPLLEKIHRHTRHSGKVPARFRGQRLEADRKELQGQLQEAVHEERFEDAARLRDQIRSMGTADESR